jgi:hypothetical protein
MSTSKDATWKGEEMKTEITAGMEDTTKKKGLAKHMDNINLFLEIILVAI